MKKLSFVLLSLTLLGSIGCSGGSGDTGVTPAVTNELQSLNAAAKKAGGDFDKLSADDQQKFITRAGTEDGARQLAKQIASGPAARGGG